MVGDQPTVAVFNEGETVASWEGFAFAFLRQAVMVLVSTSSATSSLTAERDNPCRCAFRLDLTFPAFVFGPVRGVNLGQALGREKLGSFCQNTRYRAASLKHEVLKHLSGFPSFGVGDAFIAIQGRQPLQAFGVVATDVDVSKQGRAGGTDPRQF
jgi:hypothetical protein